MKKRIAFVLACILCFMIFAPVAQGMSGWAKDEIEKAESAGLLDAEKTYAYQKPITREAFCDLLYAYVCKTSYFTDVSNGDLPWSPKTPFSDTGNYRVHELHDHDFVVGKSETAFCPDDFLTRGEAATLIIRAVSRTMPDVQMEKEVSYADIDDVSAWERYCILFAGGIGLMHGVGNNRFAPKENITTQEAILLIYRLYERYKKEKCTTDTTPDILVEYGIVDAEDFAKQGNITVLEALSTLDKAEGASLSVNIKDWYVGDSLAHMDDLSDDDKKMLLRLRDSVVTYKELPELDLDAEITNYQALLYVLRLIVDKHGCIGPWIDTVSTDVTYVFDKAKGEFLIESNDTSKANEPISRQDFYAIVHKALYNVHGAGGYAGGSVRLIDYHIEKANRAPKPEAPPEEYIEIKTDVHADADLNYTWSLPETFEFIEKDEYWTNYAFILKDGTEDWIQTSTGTDTRIDAEFLIESLLAEKTGNGDKMRMTYYTPEDQVHRYYVDVDISNVRIEEAGIAPKPGEYISFKNSWCAKEITLAKGEKYDPDCYYVVVDIESVYRKPEFNRVIRECFKPTDASDTFIAPTNRSFGVSVMEEVRLQKVTVSGNGKDGFLLTVTPLSEDTFVIEESEQEKTY